MRVRLHPGVLLAAVCLGGLLPATAVAQAIQRPIQDFISAQTNTTYWNEPATGNQMFVDYADKNNAGLHLGLPTAFSGKVTEQPLGDGRARVHVSLHTTNAYAVAWVGGKGLVFGSTSAEVIGGAAPGLADSLLTIDFVNTSPGAPLPNLLNLIYAPLAGQELEKLTFEATARGPLRAAFGVPAGTPGMAHTTQRGIYNSPGDGVALADNFPAERITVKAIGGRN